MRDDDEEEECEEGMRGYEYYRLIEKSVVKFIPVGEPSEHGAGWSRVVVVVVVVVVVRSKSGHAVGSASMSFGTSWSCMLPCPSLPWFPLPHE